MLGAGEFIAHWQNVGTSAGVVCIVVTLLYRARRFNQSKQLSIPTMPDFWRHSGFHLTSTDKDGACVPSADLLRAYFARPEVAPLAGSCQAERALFARLQADPLEQVSAIELATLADTDARENYAVVLAFRDHLVSAGTLERAYRDFFVDSWGHTRDFGTSGIPPLFTDQLAQMIVRSILDKCEDGLMARAAEILFREQRAHVADGQVLLADLETVEMKAQAARDGTRYGNLGRLLVDAQTPLRSVDLDVIESENAAIYWARDERHDTAIRINFGRSGLTALCRVIEAWVAHFHATTVRVEPVRQIESARMRWYVGLDSTATSLLNGIYNGSVPDELSRRRLLCMMTMHFDDQTVLLDTARGSPCYLALAMDHNDNVRMKPQNLLMNLPLQRRA